MSATETHEGRAAARRHPGTPTPRPSGRRGHRPLLTPEDLS
ncbi:MULTISPECIES: hypothetical protein [unclassified Streptomyces]|nr:MULTISPECIES: hypothetical protein [unclassified Streptomyces]